MPKLEERLSQIETQQKELDRIDLLEEKCNARLHT